MKQAMRWFCLGLLVISTGAQAGFSCSLFGTGKEQVAIRGKVWPVPVGLANCEGARVVSGTVTACVIDDKGRRICRPIDQAQTISAERFVKERGLRSALMAVLSIVKGNNDTDRAQSRGTMPPGFPRGRVLLHEPVVRIDLKRAGLEAATSIEFREVAGDGSTVQAEIRDLAASVESSRLKRDVEYYALIKPGELVPTPVMVTFASVADVEAVKAAMADIDRDEAAGSLGRAILRADWLKRNNFTFDAAETLRAAGLRTNESPE